MFCTLHVSMYVSMNTYVVCVLTGNK